MTREAAATNPVSRSLLFPSPSSARDFQRNLSDVFFSLSTDTNSLSLGGKIGECEDDIAFQEKEMHPLKVNEKPLTSGRFEGLNNGPLSIIGSLDSNTSSWATPQLASAKDDTAIRYEPSQHVDYL